MNCTNFGDLNSGYQVGINNGLIQLSAGKFYCTADGSDRLTTVFPSPEQLETCSEPLSTVPFPENPDIINRDALHDQIHEKASVPGSRIALVGLGGVGLEQLVLRQKTVPSLLTLE